MTKDNRMAWGVSLLVFGIMFLINQLNLLPPAVSDFIFDIKNYLFILGIIFLIYHKNKNIGIVLLVVGVLFRLNNIIDWTKNISNYIWPVLLIVAGGILIFGISKGKK